MPLLDGLSVVHSKIHGYGVVTTRPFKKGEIVCFGDGVLYKEDDDFDDTYALVLPGEDSGLGEQFFWDLVVPDALVQSLVRPEHRGAARSGTTSAKTCRAWWVALRDIPVGEEITYDYAFVAEVAEPCACGAASCRGLIVDPDPAELAKLPEHLRRCCVCSGAASAACMSTRIGILTGGGDCPGLNGVIRAVTLHARHTFGWEVVGIRNGFEGLYEEEYVDLTSRTSTHILPRGGTMLGSSNRANPFAYPVKLPDGRVEIHDVSTRCMANLAKLDLHGLIVVGGDGTMSFAQKFIERGATAHRRRAQDDRQRSRGDRLHRRLPDRRRDRRRGDRAAAHDRREPRAHHDRRGHGPLRRLDRADRGARRRRARRADPRDRLRPRRA